MTSQLALQGCEGADYLAEAPFNTGSYLGLMGGVHLLGLDPAILFVA